MYQEINEPVQVIGTYDGHGFKPKKFHWRHQTYPISEITWQSDVKDGGVHLRHYSVMVGAQLYRLIFHRDLEHWVLAQLWTE